MPHSPSCFPGVSVPCFLANRPSSLLAANSYHGKVCGDSKYRYWLETQFLLYLVWRSAVSRIRSRALIVVRCSVAWIMVAGYDFDVLHGL